MQSLDYRKLLKKFAMHVYIEDGSTYLHSTRWAIKPLGFTPEELEELKVLDAEVDAEIMANGL